MQNQRNLKNIVKTGGMKMENKTVEQLKKEIRNAELVNKVKEKEKEDE